MTREYRTLEGQLPHGKDHPVSWRFQPAHRPAVASYPTHNGVDWTYLLMPMRVTA